VADIRLPGDAFQSAFLISHATDTPRFAIPLFRPP
jgi:hypothetical protein